MTPYFTGCTAFIHYPADVARQLDQCFGDQLWQSDYVEFMADFGQFVCVGDIIVLENGEGQLIADLRHVKHVSWATVRNLTYLSEFNHTDYLVTARKFDDQKIYLHIEPQPVYGMSGFEF